MLSGPINHSVIDRVLSLNPFGCEGKPNRKQEGNRPEIEVGTYKRIPGIVRMPGDIISYQLTVPKGGIKLSIGFGTLVEHSAGPSVYFAELTGSREMVLDETYEKEGD